MAAKKRAAAWQADRETAEAHDMLHVLSPSLPELLVEDSDRAAVLVAVSLIESALTDLLTTHFKLSSNATDSECKFLLGTPPAPLGAASLKAKTARALGIIDRTTASAIKKILEIRNKFAHEIAPPAITGAMAADVINILPPSTRATFSDMLSAMEVVAQSEGGSSRPRTKLIGACLIVWRILKADEKVLHHFAKAGLPLRRLPVLVTGAKAGRKKEG
jgi:DNA-binding MltR family transcriptional regulator